MEEILIVLAELVGGAAQTTGEFFLEVVVEAGVALFERSTGLASSGTASAWLRTVLHGTLGTALGACSIWLMPHLFIATPSWQIVSLVVSPFLLGGLMAWAGSRRTRRGRTRTGMEFFGSGFAFAAAFGLMRFLMAS